MILKDENARIYLYAYCGLLGISLVFTLGYPDFSQASKPLNKTKDQTKAKEGVHIEKDQRLSSLFHFAFPPFVVLSWR